MPTDHDFELELTPHESGALDVLLRSMAAACTRRLPPTLELAGVAIYVERPCDHEARTAGIRVGGAATEELH